MNLTHTSNPPQEFAFDVQPADVALFERVLRSFVPPDTFDAHAHLYRRDHLGVSGISFVDDGPRILDLNAFRTMCASWMGGRAPRDGLFFALPRPAMDIDASNRFIADQVAGESGSRWLLLVHPDDDPAQMEQRVAAKGCAGFKVYHVFADGFEPTFDADLEAFLPEAAWRIAHDRGLAIMLHIVKPTALADEGNQRYIREHCLRYPSAKLILAHAARGFNGKHTVEGVAALRGIDNLWFDTSVVCESEPIEAILKTFGPTRLMFGGDYPFTEVHGRNVGVGEGFFWLYQDNADYGAQASLGGPTLIGIESLLAVKQACANFGATDSDVEQIFCHTGREVIGITSRSENRSGQALYEQAKTIIPGGAQLFGKRAENFAPGQWPAYFSEARGCEVVDLDGNHYIDMSMAGIGATLLGFADPDVTAVVNRRIHMGSMCTLNPADEVELARLLLEIHPWAEMARFGRMGGETMAMAVRIARARTGRDGVAFCGYHGWHDWYLAANLSEDDALSGYHLMPGLDPAGVPRGLAGSLHAFNYNRLDELKAIVDQHGGQLAAIVMEPTRHLEPAPGFLEGARELADKCGAKLIMDEVSIGWRLCLGGAHLKLGVTPHLAVFAKTLGGGHPISAVIGDADTMQAAQDTFMSSAMWTEAVGPAAGVAAVKKMMRVDVPAHVKRIGEQARAGLCELANTYSVPLVITGYPSFNTFGFDHDEALALQTLWTAKMLKRGFLVSANFYPTLAHESHHVDRYLAACEDAFATMVDGIKNNDIESRIGGPVKHAGFRRLT